MKEQNGRNGSIELMRFLLIAAIAVMHFSNSYFGQTPYFDGAYAATEFFFLVSGYLLFRSFYKNREARKEISAWKFTVHKIKNLYPYYIISFFMIFSFSMLSERAGIGKWLVSLGKSVWELSFLQISGLKGFVLYNYPAWYISAMLLAGYFIYTLLELWEKKFVKFVMPLSVLLIYCFFSKNAESIDVWGGAKIFDISDALMRAFAGMCLGGISYYASIAIGKKELKGKTRLLLTGSEIAVFILAMILMAGVGHTQTDFYVIALLASAVILAFSGQTHTEKLFSNAAVNFLGKISYPMFLNQIFVISLFGTFWEGLGYKEAVLLFMAVLTVISLAEMLVLYGLRRVIWKKK
ncbi:acyltransferase family protein [Konateibacter massiliensis]|uniref:acyltransferase family protein n=1 Tax=Konateibacter massiliensis TaxID=2002841 RepID=UPI000C151F55|nr:acyltransferase [Konateibacter massiliensis]